MISIFFRSFFPRNGCFVEVNSLKAVLPGLADAWEEGCMYLLDSSYSLYKSRTGTMKHSWSDTLEDCVCPWLYRSGIDKVDNHKDFLFACYSLFSVLVFITVHICIYIWTQNFVNFFLIFFLRHYENIELK